MKYTRARSRSMVFDHFGTRHSSVISGRFIVRGSWMITLVPVERRYGVDTLFASAVDHKRASAPPPVSSARYCFDSSSYQRGLITQLYGPFSRSRFCGLGIVV